MANYENIEKYGFDKMPEEERKRLGSKGGKASGETRRRKRLMEQEADLLLSRQCRTKKGKKALEELGIKTGSNQMAMVAQQVISALEGDMNALNWLRDILGEKPAEKLDSSLRTVFGFEGIDDECSG